MEERYEFQLITDLRKKELLPLCAEWSEQTYKEADMLPHTPEWMLNNYVCAAIARFGSNLVGAAGIIPVLEGEKILYFDNKPVYELCSNFVNINHQKKGIATNLVHKRLIYARENGWLPVIVTKNQDIIKIARKLGLVQTLTSDRFIELGKKIRDCTCQNRQGKPFFGEPCRNCPINGGKSIWVLPPDIPLPMIIMK